MGFPTFFHKFRPAASMILVQTVATGMVLLSKVVLNRGTFIFALMMYRHFVAAAFVCPFAYMLEREGRKKLSLQAFIWIFINALFGITVAMGLYYYGLYYTTATFASTFLNVIPAVTFLFAAMARIERLGFGSAAGCIKVMGTLLCVGGAITATLYKGTSFNILPSHFHHEQVSHKLVRDPEWTRGALMLAASCISYSIWYMLQIKLVKVFPARYWGTMLTCLAGGLQSAVIGVAMNRKRTAWRLGLDLQLVTILYSGVFASGVTFMLISWCISQRGPTYATMFNPLLLIFSAIAGSLLLHEPIYIGSVVGAGMIVGGLYAFLWGKKNEPQPNLAASNGESAGRPSTANAGIAVQSVMVAEEAAWHHTGQLRAGYP